jgi:hypothetical protein
MEIVVSIIVLVLLIIYLGDDSVRSFKAFKAFQTLKLFFVIGIFFLFRKGDPILALFAAMVFMILNSAQSRAAIENLKNGLHR